MVTYLRESEAGEGAREDARLKDEEKGVGEGGGGRGGDGEKETEENQRDYAVVDLYRG